MGGRGFRDHGNGSLTPGKLADLVLLDCDIFKIDPAQIDKVKVTLTVVDGKVAYEAK